MKCEVRPIELKLRRDFIVAGGRESLKHNFIFIIKGMGLGEAAGSIHYGVPPEEIETDLKRAAEYLAGIENDEPGDILGNLREVICSPALCAASTAWHDWHSKRDGVSLYTHLKLEPPQIAETSLTVSLGDTESLANLLQSGYRHIKLKMDADDTRNDQLIEKISKSEGSFFRIDANGSWTFDDARRLMASLPDRKVTLIEQPFPPDSIDDWNRLQGITRTPLFMDESIVSADDVKRVAGYVDGVNIKIQKSGLLDTAVEAMNTAHSLGLMVMLGCMIESSVGIAAAYHLSSMADYLDLDGRLLLESDPFQGLTYDSGNLKLSTEIGHGVSFA